ncbi:hypothetical protein [Algibacter mikhailovii]|uniref:Sensor of ECF-type sigma factor n=1 Tax=Algibacter mikhailovii TaxID=425498 RepID=A0A918R1L5_9FLAO|nr:hypothetical protein [Algibacter mikhailovii]GGZ80568.1 hypothetical protein GCM10007028_17400 [Algibacter mikhailovii]
MKKSLLIFAALILSIASFAQSNEYIELTRSVLKTETKAAIAGVMNLTEAQSAPFWDLYNEFETQNYNVQNKRIALIKDYAKNYENLTDDKANELVNQYFAYKQEDLKLKKKYYKKIKKVVPATESAKFLQAINKIDDLINAELALDIPLIKTE